MQGAAAQPRRFGFADGELEGGRMHDCQHSQPQHRNGDHRDVRNQHREICRYYIQSNIDPCIKGAEG